MIRSWFRPLSERFGMRRQQHMPKRTLFVLTAILFVAVFGNWLANDPQKNFVPPLIPYSATLYKKSLPPLHANNFYTPVT